MQLNNFGSSMQAGSNAKAKAFLEDHTDWNPSAPIRTKWNCRAAALYKDKVGQVSLLIYLEVSR